MSLAPGSYSAIIQARSAEFAAQMAARGFPHELSPPLAQQSPAPQLRRASPSVAPPATCEVLSCGSELPLSSADFHETQLPLPNRHYLGFDDLPPPPREQKPRKFSGCGTRIGTASPHAEKWVWSGNLDNITPTVVSLETEYVPPEAVAAMDNVCHKTCGCWHSWVGCAVCGNTLGMLLTPCHHHESRGVPGVYLFLPTAVSPPLPPPHPRPHTAIPIAPITAENLTDQQRLERTLTIRANMVQRMHRAIPSSATPSAGSATTAATTRHLRVGRTRDAGQPQWPQFDAPTYAGALGDAASDHARLLALLQRQVAAADPAAMLHET
ncbi:hypothetical protein C8R43DRAFT_1244366 [Mycena crocata]|nr:hypothetical protein C8R43DRAFT_1244366 [Mycena crocata]